MGAGFLASTWANVVTPVMTAAGIEIMINGTGSVLRAGNASIVGLNSNASNGQIHVIDKVLTN